MTDLTALLQAHGDESYREFLRGQAMTMGLFAPGPGPRGRQDPHDEDELYVVLAGWAVLDVDGARHALGTGAIVYVPRGVPHDFLDVSADLRVLVVFAPPGRA